MTAGVGVAALSGALGVGPGACLRSPAVAVATVLGWSSFGEGLLSAVVPEPLLPVGAIRTAVTHGTSVLAWLSVGVLAVYAAIVMILAARVFTRKDVTV